MNQDPFVHHMRLKKPCANCPFLTDRKKAIPLREGRVEDILQGLMTGEHSTFSCHKTLDGVEHEDGSYEQGGSEALCAGAAAVLMKRRRPCLMMRLAFSLGVSKLDQWDAIKDQVID